MLRPFLGLLLLTSLLLNAPLALAEPYRRLVNFEWEAIEGAKHYEVELQQIKDEDKGKTFNFKVKVADWNGRLTPGKYIMRLRSFDYRGVPGDWSPPSDFNVGLDPVKIESPVADAKIKSNDAEQVAMDFKWAAVGGAESYHFILTSEDGKTTVDEWVKEPKFNTKVPVAQNYTWKVSAKSPEGIESEATSVAQFSLLGKPLEKPEIIKPENEFVRQLTWKRPDNVKTFDVYVMKQNVETKKWEKFQVFENYADDTLAFDDTWPGGKYQLAIKAKSDMRPDSPIINHGFSVRSGDRSPAAEYTALVRKSIERVSGWYGIASYLMTQMKFSGANPEKNSVVSYDAIGGTGRMGAGWFDSSKSWGFLGILDMSGFTFQGSTQTFASLEANAVYRYSLGDRGEVRLQMGPFYKELPETIGDIFTNNFEYSTVSAVGPHVGAEYWYSLTPKFGLQFNLHLYMPLMKVSTPNGQAIDPTLSTQIGFMGSYRFTSTFTGLAGYTRREDNVAYKAVSDTTTFAEDGDINKSTIVGNYLNFFAEWSF